VTRRSSVRALMAGTLVVALALFAVGCGIPRELPADGDPVRFPHPEGYIDSHATLAEGGAAPCADCHGLRDGDLAAGAVPAAPSCRSCHATYPHPVSFAAGVVHATAQRSDPDSCATCHGPDGARPAGGSERGRCTHCHSTYPHAEGWVEPAGHGAAARERGQPGCQGCHGAGGDEVDGVSCAECHAPPHPAGFASPAEHGAQAQAQPESCAACHAEAATAPGRRLCASCHDLYPHPADWSATHLAAVDARGRLSCAGCHPGGVPGPALPATCGRGCHDGSAQ